MCIIAVYKFPTQTVIAKNRETPTEVNFEIVHTQLNGIEILYFHDLDSGWVEGINDKGIGITAAELVRFIRKPPEERARSCALNTISGFNNIGVKILHALQSHTIKEAKQLVSSLKLFSIDIGLNGNTIVSTKEEAFHVENFTGVSPVVTPINLENGVIFTNYPTINSDKELLGESYDEQYSQDNLSRQRYLQKNQNNINCFEDLFRLLLVSDINQRYERQVYKPFVSEEYHNNHEDTDVTSSQLFWDLTNLHLTFIMDVRFCTYHGYRNMLGKLSTPKLSYSIFTFDGRQHSLIDSRGS